jgi:hypothetical protein
MEIGNPKENLPFKHGKSPKKSGINVTASPPIQ